jgi:hypothetical protein
MEKYVYTTIAVIVLGALIYAFVRISSSIKRNTLYYKAYLDERVSFCSLNAFLIENKDEFYPPGAYESILEVEAKLDDFKKESEALLKELKTEIVVQEKDFNAQVKKLIEPAKAKLRERVSESGVFEFDPLGLNQELRETGIYAEANGAKIGNMIQNRKIDMDSQLKCLSIKIQLKFILEQKIFTLLKPEVSENVELRQRVESLTVLTVELLKRSQDRLLRHKKSAYSIPIIDSFYELDHAFVVDRAERVVGILNFLGLSEKAKELETLAIA